MNGGIDQLIEFIAQHFSFDVAIYPELKGATEDERLKFAIRHSALHFAKTAGKIAAVSEDADHGEDINIEDLKINISKSLINTLRLAELVQLSEDDLTKRIYQLYEPDSNSKNVADE